MFGFLKNFYKNKKAAVFFFSAAFGFGLLFWLAAVLPASAGFIDLGLSDAAKIGLGGADIRVIIIRIIRILLSFLGIVAVIIVLYGGYLWMTSAGNAQRVDLAKQVLKNGLIGLVIILAAYSIVYFIITWFLGSILNDGGGPGPGPGPCTNCGALGGGIIEDHYPGRNARDIPRNDHISITFKEPILVLDKDDIGQSALWPRSFIEPNPAITSNPSDQDANGNWSGEVNSNIFKLQPVQDNGSLGNEVELFAYTASQKRMFTLYPVGLLGSPDRDTKYRATVKGNVTGLAKAADLTWHMGGDYTWDFTVSTFLDTTPPKVVDVYPVDSQTEARNVSVVMTFSEPIDPVSIVYNVSPNPYTVGFHQNPPDADVAGVIDVTNYYRTVTFHTSVKCGVNSCDQDIYCFEANAAIDGLIKAATLVKADPPICPNNLINDNLRSQNNPSAACVGPNTGTLFFDGIVDMAGNSLDGSPGIFPAQPLPSGDGTADGPPNDNYTWTFNTDDKIVKSGPKIVSIEPTNEAAGVGRDDPAKGTFNRRLLRFVTDDFRFYENGASFSPRWARQSIQYDCGVTGEACFPPSQRKVCSGGPRNGEDCNKQTDCNPPNGVGGNTCNTVRVCRGGDRPNQGCTADAECPGNPAGVCPIANCPAIPLPPPNDSEERNECGRTTAELNHGTFAEDQTYEPRVGSTVLDVYQNCYVPTFGPFICNGGSNDGQSCAVPASSDTACVSGGGICVSSYNNLGETTLPLDP